MKRFVALLLILALAGGIALGQEAVEEPITYDDVVAAIGTMNELLEQAIYQAAAGIAARSYGDQNLYAQSLVNALEGDASPLYDPSIERPGREIEGLMPLWARIQTAAIEEIALDVLPAAHWTALGEAWQGVGPFLLLASKAAQEAVNSGEEGAAESLRSVYAYLLAARGGFNDPYLMGGTEFLEEIFPSREIWVRSGDSIQDAIDRIPDGGTIYVEPGTYRETLAIEKSLTLIGGARVPTIGGVHGNTHIKGVEWRPSILVTSETPIVVRIENVMVTDADHGVAVSGQAHLTLSRVDFHDNKTGLAVLGDATAICEFLCMFISNEVGVFCAGNSRCELLNDSRIQWSTGHAGAVEAFGNAEVVIDGSYINGNSGDGILLFETSKLQLTGSSIWDNEGYGIRTTGNGCLGGVFATGSARFTGQITGGGNTIRGGDEENGNLQGAVCPAELVFLTEPLPEEE